MKHSFLHDLERALATGTALETGCPSLDQILEICGARRGQLLYLCGRERRVELTFLLGCCRTACERGEGSAFLDMTGTLTPQLIELAGLTPYYSANLSDGAGNCFRVRSPRRSRQIVRELRALAQDPLPPAVVVVYGLIEQLQARLWPALLRRQGGRVWAKLTSQLFFWGLEAQCAGFTLWIAKAPPAAGVENMDSTVNPESMPYWMLYRLLCKILHRKSDFSVVLGSRRQTRVSQEPGGKGEFSTTVDIWRQEVRMASLQNIELRRGSWSDGD